MMPRGKSLASEIGATAVSVLFGSLVRLGEFLDSLQKDRLVEDQMNTRRTLNVAAGIVLIAACIMGALMGSGCATVPQYGDGKMWQVPLDPAVDALAKALDSKAQGSGDYVRKWFATSGVDRVPPGYAIRWTAYLDGKAIDETAIVRVPSLVVREGATPIPPPAVAVTNAPDRDPLNELGGLLNGQ